MKKEIHPDYVKTVVTCYCGNRFETKSTVPEINVEICSLCHPFYTGKQKLVDTAGRVDKFRSKMAAAKQIQEQKSRHSVKNLKNKKETKLEQEITEIKEEFVGELVSNQTIDKKDEA